MSGGKLANVPSDWATRTSLDLVEIAMPAQIDQLARSGVNNSKMSRCELPKTADVTDGWAKSAHAR
jgi:hypothetical protein